MKIFLDANILIAAAGSDSGASRYLFSVAERDPRWQLLTSAYALAEARANVLSKLPARYAFFTSLITSTTLTVVHPPAEPILKLTRGLVPPKDEPILAAAISCSANALCTLDKKDFHTPKVKSHCRSWSFRIVLPKDLLEEWRAEQRT